MKPLNPDNNRPTIASVKNNQRFQFNGFNMLGGKK